MRPSDLAELCLLAAIPFLGERPTDAMAIGCAVIRVGKAFATGLLPWRARPRPAVM